MAHYFKAEYSNGSVVERWGMTMHGLKLNGLRPHTISVVPQVVQELSNAVRSVHPIGGKVI
jgi:hypothetical protein